jgi:hypothetical protein
MRRYAYSCLVHQTKVVRVGRALRNGQHACLQLYTCKHFNALPAGSTVLILHVASHYGNARQAFQ